MDSHPWKRFHRFFIDGFIPWIFVEILIKNCPYYEALIFHAPWSINGRRISLETCIVLPHISSLKNLVVCYNSYKCHNCYTCLNSYTCNNLIICYIHHIRYRGYRHYIWYRHYIRNIRYIHYGHYIRYK